MITIRKFKDFVIDTLPEESPLRKVLVEEDNEMSQEEFLAKFPLWWELAGVVPDAMMHKRPILSDFKT